MDLADEDMSLKQHLLTIFPAVRAHWSLSAPPQELSSDVKQRMYWLQIRHMLQEIIRQLRLIQRPEDRHYKHLTNNFKPIDEIYDKFVDLWANYIKVENLDIPEEHVKCRLICNMCYNLCTMFFSQRRRLSFQNTD